MSDTTVKDVERLDSGGDVLQRAITGERKAWARLVSTIACAGAAVMARHGIAEAKVECEAARQALRDLGVDVDTLLEIRRSSE